MAKNGGIATLTTNSDVNVTGGTVLLKAATNLDVAQGVAAATPATVSSSAGGVATLTTSAKAVVTGNAMSLTAGSNVSWNSGGSLNVGSGSLSSITADSIAQYMGVAAGKSPSLKIAAGGTVNVGNTTMTGNYIYLQANPGAISSAGATLNLPTNTVVQWVSPTAGSMDVSGTYTSLPFGLHSVIFGAQGYTTNLTIGAGSAATFAGETVGFDATGKITGSNLVTAKGVVFAAGGSIDALTKTGNLTVVSGTKVNLDDTAYTGKVTVYGTQTKTVNVSLDTATFTLASGQTINADDTAFTGAITANGGTTKAANLLLDTTDVTLTGGQHLNVDDTAETSATSLTMSGNNFGAVSADFGASVVLGGTMTATSLILTTPGNITDATSTYKLGAAEFNAGGNIDLHDMSLTIGSGTITGVTGDKKLIALLGLVKLDPKSSVPNGVFTAGKGKSITLGNLTMTGSYLQLNADAFSFDGTVTAPSGSVVQLAPISTSASISIEQKAAKLGTINFNAGQLTLFPTVVIGGQDETGNATIGTNGPVQLDSTNLFIITTGKVKGLNLLQSSGIVGDLTTIIYPGGGFQVPTASEIMGFNRVFGFEYPPIVLYGGEGGDLSYSDPFLAPCLVVVPSEDQKSYKCASGGD
ncbi:MAG: beta strand repeat-containing protein [Gammaproteobacteria bacterium]